jgi:catechol 2,3-dioxygenase-like lactoylglutathione lyase family enzyme
MDNVLVVVDDLEAAKAFFAELGLELEGETIVEGPPVDRLIGLEGVRATIASMRTPGRPRADRADKFHTPAAVRPSRRRPVNALGIRPIMFAGRRHRRRPRPPAPPRRRARRDVVQYEDDDRLCYVRGPEGIIVALAEHARLSGGQTRALRTDG